MGNNASGDANSPLLPFLLANTVSSHHSRPAVAAASSATVAGMPTATSAHTPPYTIPMNPTTRDFLRLEDLTISHAPKFTGAHFVALATALPLLRSLSVSSCRGFLRAAAASASPLENDYANDGSRGGGEEQHIAGAATVEDTVASAGGVAAALMRGDGSQESCPDPEEITVAGESRALGLDPEADDGRGSCNDDAGPIGDGDGDGEPADTEPGFEKNAAIVFPTAGDEEKNNSVSGSSAGGGGGRHRRRHGRLHRVESNCSPTRGDPAPVGSGDGGRRGKGNKPEKKGGRRRKMDAAAAVVEEGGRKGEGNGGGDSRGRGKRACDDVPEGFDTEDDGGDVCQGLEFTVDGKTRAKLERLAAALPR